MLAPRGADCLGPPPFPQLLLHLLLAVLVMAATPASARECASWRTYNVGVLMASRLDSPFDLERCGPAVDLALEVVNEVYVRHHCVRLNKVQKSYPSCSGAVAPGLAADLHFQQNAIAFIGPACAFALEPVARLAAYWNTPIITGMGDQPPSEGELSVTSGILSRHLKPGRNGTSVRGMFQNKTAYPTLTRMSYCQCRLVQVFAAIFHQFAWRHVALILDKSDLFSLTVGKNLEHGLRKAGVLKYVRELDGSEEDGIEGYLTDASMYARVVILSVRGVLKRRFMLTAHTMGMTRGDWTFLDVDIFHGSFWGDRGWAWNESTDADARQAYEALLRVSLLVPTSRGFTEFADKVRQRALEHYNYNFSADEEVNFFIGAFYDGVALLGMALNETLAGGGDITDGVAVTRRMWNREFDGITGHVRIDDSGDRDADYSVLDLDPITGRFEEVAHYSGMTKNYTPLEGKRIHWPGGRTGPPPDVPRCGFMGSACSASQPSLLLTSVILAVCLLLAGGVTAACVAYRRVKEAADLHNMSWRVRPEEVLLEVGKTFSSRLGLQKNSEMFEPGLERLHCRRCSAESGASLPPAQVFTTIGIYKGSRVAIKKITKTRVDITKKLLYEVKQVRDVSHENTVRFVGACVQAPAVIILTEYCPKGSLRDVLENDALKLDWNLRMSLIHDLVKGMVYLHGCEVAAHGKLRSGNCLIDSRFVLKVSDFGLATLTAPSEVVKDQAYYTKLLWIAPELLPLTEAPGAPASQKGDVYSFGIILEEIMTRAGPFEQARQLLSPQEVVARVQARESPPLRPVVAAGRDCPEALQDLMERCWADGSDDRPSFEAIRGEVRRIMKGYCENLMDDLLRRMEQYATNLEALVEEKTAQLSQEKRRSEELLYQVLPRPVAQQLMAGEMVRPEQFECVTVYFSDIVGFTALCAESTPIQVVDFLNDLYSTFDRIIGAYDVYKVETIGDAYMVVSGLPERNGDQHVREIALMALAILDAVRTFQIQHRPDQQLAVRIGVHSGPVCAGVVGQKMPHLCLFGDTVNTASRMESTGQPQRIHVSDAARHLLDKLGTFCLEERGIVELKGKGRVRTHWLLGCTAPDPRADAAAPCAGAAPWAPCGPCHACQCGGSAGGEVTDPTNPYPLLFPALSTSK